MADPNATNGAPPASSEDIHMKDENETQLNQTSDPTDPNPPPQPASVGASLEAESSPTHTEHLSTIQPPPSAIPQLQQQQSTSRPGSQPPTSTAPRPDKPVAHGGPTRQYLNAHVTPHLLEAMKQLAVQQPEKPLAWLSEFLKERSGEVEGV